MLGHRDPQRRLFSTATMLGDDQLKRMGFYGQLAKEGHRLFDDEDFAAPYCGNNGRPSAPPSLLAVATLLQYYAGVSDAEAMDRCRFDLRWKTALHLDTNSIDAPFAKSTFQSFRARLTLHEQEGILFEKSIREAKLAGLLPAKLRLSLDNQPSPWPGCREGHLQSALRCHWEGAAPRGRGTGPPSRGSSPGCGD